MRGEEGGLKNEQPQSTDYLTIREVADRLRLTPSYVYKLCAQGQIPFFRFGRKSYRVARGDLIAWERARKET